MLGSYFPLIIDKRTKFFYKLIKPSLVINRIYFNQVILSPNNGAYFRTTLKMYWCS